MTRPLKLLALVPKPVGQAPGQRFRLEQWAPVLRRDHGIDLQFRPFESPELNEVVYKRGHHLAKAKGVLLDAARRYRDVLDARDFDGAVVYREASLIGPAIYERVIARMGIPLYFDFDDAIWMQQPGGGQNGVFARLHFWGKTSTTCRISTGVIVGNGYLADYARARNPNTFIVPTSIDLSRYPVQPPLPPDAPFTIVWSGSTHTLPHLEEGRRVLERLGAMRKTRLRVICNQPPARPFENVDLEFVPWTQDSEARDLGASHVGIMPLPDDPFARGKCALKGLQYMAVARPSVLSPVGVNVDVVQNGQNGYLATTDDDWLRILNELADDAALRARIGAAGRRTIEERYTTEVAAAAFAKAVRSTIASRPASRHSPHAGAA